MWGRNGYGCDGEHRDGSGMALGGELALGQVQQPRASSIGPCGGSQSEKLGKASGQRWHDSGHWRVSSKRREAAAVFAEAQLESTMVGTTRMVAADGRSTDINAASRDSSKFSLRGGDGSELSTSYRVAMQQKWRRRHGSSGYR
ncbi:hypothetical protein NL676_021413 [Syzygium grande]|nr:hypothetical protein NL676_021413 [Syzygium grande]